MWKILCEAVSVLRVGFGRTSTSTVTEGTGTPVWLNVYNLAVIAGPLFSNNPSVAHIFWNDLDHTVDIRIKRLTVKRKDNCFLSQEELIMRLIFGVERNRSIILHRYAVHFRILRRKRDVTGNHRSVLMILLRVQTFFLCSLQLSQFASLLLFVLARVDYQNGLLIWKITPPLLTVDQIQRLQPISNADSIFSYITLKHVSSAQRRCMQQSTNWSLHLRRM